METCTVVVDGLLQNPESPESQRRVKLRFAFFKEYGKVTNSGAMNEDAVDGVPTFP